MTDPDRAAAPAAWSRGDEQIAGEAITSQITAPSKPAHQKMPFDIELGRATLGPSFVDRASAELVIAVRADAWPLAEHDGPPDPILTARRAGVDLAVVHELLIGAWSPSMVPLYCAELERDARLRRIVHRAAALSEAAIESASDTTIARLFADLANEVGT